jgi:hypothetical protein
VSDLWNYGSIQPNIFYNLFWFWYFTEQAWLRKTFYASLLFILRLCGLFSLLATFFPILPKVTSLDSSNYFVPINRILGLTFRQEGIFSHPNTYAFFSFLLIGFTFVLNQRFRILWLCIGTFGLLTSGSRTFQFLAILFLSLVFCDFVFKKLNYLRNRIINIPLILYFLSSSFLAFQALPISSSFGFVTLSGRYEIWSQNFKAFLDQPILGLGTKYASMQINEGLLSATANSVHSLYGEGFISGGIIYGTLSLFLFLVVLRNMKFLGGHSFNIFFLIFLAGITETMFSLASFGVLNLLFAYAYATCSPLHR